MRLEMRALLLILSLGASGMAQIIPRVSNSLGCTHFGSVSGVRCAITLTEGLDVMATFTLDQPIVCDANDDFECAVVVNISNSHPHIVAVEPCFVHWSRTEWHQQRQVRITAVQNYRSVAGETHEVHLNAQTVSTAPYYHNYDVEDFYIETQNRRTAQCRSTGDPHYTTFDGKYWHYYRASRVTLYRAPNRDFAIQTQTRAYPGRNCAIAGRENENRVIIDNCGGGLRVQTNYNSADPALHPRVQVSGNTYTVYFYSGAWVRAQVNGWGMNVYTASVDFTPSNARAPHTCGLCGNFDGNPNNDVPGYRITSYNPLWPCMKIPSIATRPRDGAQVSFGSIWNWQYDPADFTNATVLVPLPQVTCPYEFQRIDRPIINTQDTEDITDALNNRVDAAQNNNNFGFTFDGGNATVVADYPMNLSLAACHNNIDTSATVRQCRTMYAEFNDTLANYTEDCAEDYSHSGGPTTAGTAFLAASLRALEAQCLQLAVQNNDTTILALQQVLCDNACSGQGRCGAGAICMCNSGFAGADCSVNITAPPVITSASDIIYDSAGLMRNHTPREILVSGSNFLFGSNLSCSFNGTITRATYIGVTQVLCDVPALYHRGPVPARVPLQLTNDGVQWSDPSEAQFVYYDGTCQACTDTGVCGPNPATCIIDGQCYLPNVQRPATGPNNPTNPCQLCLPGTNNTGWTWDYSHQACHPIFTQQIYGAEIVGAALAGTTMTGISINAFNNPLVTGDPSYSITYSYSSSVSSSLIRQWFLVDPSTGAITLNETVNMSDPVFMNMQHAATSPQNFDGFFRVIATDQQGYTASADVTIDLVPLTVHGALFPSLGFVGIVPENSATGQPVMNLSNPSQPLIITPLTDNVTVTSYEWFLQPQGLTGALQINPSTGAVTVGSNGAALDYESTSQLNYRIRATATLQYIVPLYVEITNVPEFPTAVVATPTEPSVAEGDRADNWIANLSTIDGDANATSDGGPFTYTLMSETGRFELLQWSTGMTYLAARNGTTFDFETQNGPIVVSVQSTDPTQRSVTSSFTIRVTDVNEAPVNVRVSSMPAGTEPEGVQVSTAGTSCTISVQENLTIGSEVAVLTATDPDANSTRPPCFVIDPLGYFGEDTQLEHMRLQSSLDYETTESFPVTITCTDANDYGLETSMQCNVSVGDVPEAPLLSQYNYTGGVINETTVRTDNTVVGTIVVVDPDANSGSTIQITAPSGYNTTDPSCVTTPNTGVQCTADLVLLPGTPLSFANSTRGTVVVPVTVSQGGLDRTVQVNVTVADQPELPTGVALELQGTLYENPSVDFVIARITIEDPDTTPQSFAVALTNNPNNAFAIEPVTGNPLSYWLKVANPAAFNFQEGASRLRRQGANLITVGITISEPAHPELGSFLWSHSFTIADRPLEWTANSTTISPYVGGDAVQFSLRYQDIPSMEAYLRWTLENTTMTAAMGTVAISPSGALTVTSPGGLCPDGGADRFWVFLRYDFSSFTGTLPSGYESTSLRAELIMGSATTNFPYFNNIPSSGSYDVVIRPSALQTDTQSIPVDVNAPCRAQLDFTLSVITTPLRVAAGTDPSSLTGDELVRSGAGYLRPQSVQELQNNIANNIWSINDIYNISQTSNLAVSSSPFAFTFSYASNTPQTGTRSILRAHYFQSSEPALGLTDTNKVLLAELTGTGRAVVAPITFRYLDGCGRDALGNQVQSNNCAVGETCISSFLNQRWTASCTPAIDVEIGEQSGDSAGSDSNTGLWVGIVLVIIFLIIIALVVFLRHQKNTHTEWDPENGQSRSATYNNPTYEAAGGVTRTVGDTEFRSGEKNAVYEWYKPTMTRRECTEYLLAQGEGAFVVRDSDSNQGWHMLGVKTSNRVVHDKIRLTDDGSYELLPSVGDAADVKQPTFKALPDLIEHYLLNSGNLGYELVDSNPIYDNHQLIQERTGEAVKAQYDDMPSVPQKNRAYDEIPSALTAADGVSNPMYGQEQNAAGTKNLGYLEVAAEPYESI